MRLSNYFLPTLKETPSEAQIVSHRLMLRSGMIRQSSAGIYSWLPIGLRVLRKIEKIVREEQHSINCHEVLMPTIQSADLWKKSGRYEDYGPEMLRLKDRQDRDLLYGPTNEEQITEIFANTIRSYKDLPQLLYHIQWKFRDEVRPRFGVMRGREFLMKDAYSFDLDKLGAKNSYNKMFISYLKTFKRMGLQAIPMAADTGPIGGNLSHEFLILAETGESEIACHHEFINNNWLEGVDSQSDLEKVVNTFTEKYAATDEMRNLNEEETLGNNLISARGIEVGHIFYFGKKYSEKLGAFVNGPNGEEVAVEMGSYGIGISRLVGAVIESSHDVNGIIWPESIAPYSVGLINIRYDDDNCINACNDMYALLKQAGIEVLFDDREKKAGEKFSDMDLIGLPWQIIIGPRSVQDGTIEFKNRKTGQREELSANAVLRRLKG